MMNETDPLVAKIVELETQLAEMTKSLETMALKTVELQKSLGTMTELAEEGWSYAPSYFQAKWLPGELLNKWFPDNTEKVRFEPRPCSICKKMGHSVLEHVMAGDLPT
jgi:hypothetical protein